MDKVKKLIAVTMCVSMVCAMLPFETAFADNIIDEEGNNGSIVQTMNEDGTVIYRGENEDAFNIELSSFEDYSNTVVIDGIRYGLYGSDADAIGFTPEIPKELAIPSKINVGGTQYSVKKIADNAFYTCTIPTTVTIPEGVISIGRYAFSGCSGCRTIHIPVSVTDIGSNAFSDMTALTAFDVAAGNSSYRSVSGELISGDKLLYYPISAQAESYTVPDGVTEIAHNAFSYSKYVKKVTLSDSVKTISYEAFAESRLLEEVVFGDGLETIESDSFYCCTNFKSLHITKNVKSMDDNIILNCSSCSVITVDEGNTDFTVINDALYDIGSKTLIAYPPASKRKEVEISNLAEAIGSQAFWHAVNVERVIIPDSITDIMFGAFTGCAFEEITIGTGVEEIGNHAFQACTNLKKVTINEGLTRIGDNCFNNNICLEEINIPNSVEKIGNAAFEGCTALTEINVGSDNQNYFSNDGVLYSMDGELLAYPLGKTDREFVLPSGAKSFAGGVFYGSRYLESFAVAPDNEFFSAYDGVLFSQDMTVLYAYPSARNTSGYTVPDGVKAIYDYAFAESQLSEIIMPDSLEEIGDSAFRFCGGLEQVNLDKAKTLHTIKDCAFFRCDILKSITIPENVSLIGRQAFDYCFGLEYITFLGETAPEIKHMLLRHDSALRYVYVPFGTADVYKAVFSAGNDTLAPDATIVEGEKVKLEDALTAIKSLTGSDSADVVNNAAELYIRLTKAENATVSDKDIINLEKLFKDANSDLSVSINNDISALSADGYALSGGITEGAVNLNITEEESDIGELLRFKAELEVNDSVRQICSPVLFSVVIPDGYLDRELKVIHTDSDGKDEKLNYEMQGNVMRFRATSFSTFTISVAGGGAGENTIDISDGEITVNVRKAAVLIVAERDENMMQRIMFIRRMDEGENIVPVSELGAVENARLYLWNSLEAMKPLSKTKTLNNK